MISLALSFVVLLGWSTAKKIDHVTHWQRFAVFPHHCLGKGCHKWLSWTVQQGLKGTAAVLPSSGGSNFAVLKPFHYPDCQDSFNCIFLQQA